MAQVSDVHLSGLKCQTERRVTDWRSSNGQQLPGEEDHQAPTDTPARGNEGGRELKRPQKWTLSIFFYFIFSVKLQK